MSFSVGSGGGAINEADATRPSTTDPGNLYYDALMARFRSMFKDKSLKGLSNVYSKLGGPYAPPQKNNTTSKAVFLVSFTQNNGVEIPTVEIKSPFSREELEDIFELLDTNKDGTLQPDEFVFGVRGPLPVPCQYVVNYVFQKLDLNASGFIEMEDLAAFYDASLFPDILMKETTGRHKVSHVPPPVPLL
jgi:hypothetical protein